ncbi:uncharacterized protein LOC133303951 [Gastrolobium bilobum]|uniref:uncharacterized protein LOC133303951 n=1 Tax=Gastrolobium bilobum TaxID=150636 RepID=UPI002AAF31D9|nr:uncharacterized protein LOC133303951 [Gastrolobium bilobum]
MANLVMNPDFNTNPSHPFFLHLSESPSLILVTPPLDGGNYHSWARGMTVALISKSTIDFVNRSIIPPDLDDPAYAAWQRCDTMVMAWLHRSISESIVKSILWIELARDVWLDLRERFSQADVFRVSDLMEEAYRLQQGDESVSQYYTQLKTVWDELENLKPLPICSCPMPCVCGAISRVREYREQEQVIRFLKGLKEQFAPVRSQIMLISPLPSVNRAFSLVSQQERQFQSESHALETKTSHAFTVTNAPTGNYRRGDMSYGGRFNNGGRYNNGGRGRGRSNSGRYYNGGNQPNRVCTHCGRSNHTIESCYQLHGFPPGYRTYNRSQTPQTALTTSSQIHDADSLQEHSVSSEPHKHISQHEYQHLMELLQRSNPEEQSNVTQAHASNLVQVSNISTAKGTSNSQWIVDTGATNHFAHSIKDFTSIRKIQPLSIYLPNGFHVIAHY